MPFLDKLERAFGRFAIPNLTLYIIIGQVFFVLTSMFGLVNPAYLPLIPQLVLAGQWWRLITFVLVPPAVGGGTFGLVFLVFAWWVFYFMGSAMEGYWGAFRYNLFLFAGYLLTAGLAFLVPGWIVSNAFLAGSVFLAFAYLNPDFELVLFFILPVKIKWLALFTWVLYLFEFIKGGWGERLQIVAAVGNFFLFFGGDLWQGAGLRRRQMAEKAVRAARSGQAPEIRHRCRICGKTDRTHPQLDFRYCSKCAGDQCYCPEHIYNHEHVTGEDEAKTAV